MEKALTLLGCSKPRAEVLSLTVLTQVPDMHKITMYRLMNSLERISYVIRSESNAYSLEPRLLYLGKLYEQSFHLSSMVEPVLRALAAATRESASYCAIDHERRPCLFRTEPLEGLRKTRLPGTSLPLDDTATSHVLRYWGLSEVLCDGTPELPLFTSGARDQHTAAFATSVFGSGDKFVAVFTPSGTASQLEAAHIVGDSVAKQLQAASELSCELGASTALCERLHGA